MGTGDLCRVSLAAVHLGRAKQCSGTGPCGYCRRVLWVPGPRSLYSGKIRFIEKPGVQDEGGRHVAKRSSDPPGSLPRSQFSGTGPSASWGYCCPLCLAGNQYSGEIRCIDRTSQTQYTCSLILPSWRHET